MTPRTQSYVRFAVLCAKQIYRDPGWNQWADDWLSGRNRKIQAAAMAAAWAAESASREMEWAAIAAAWAAESASTAAAATAESASIAAAWAAVTVSWVERGRGREAEPADIQAIATEANLSSPTCDEWQALSLIPRTKSSHLLWKHVTAECKGNLGFVYRMGKPFVNDGMACAGPFGALRDWESNETDSHLLAIDATIVLDYEPAKGIYMCVAGTPIAFYRAHIVGEELEATLLDGIDALAMVQP